MRAWTIHDPAPAAAPSASRAADVVVVKDGFAWWALFFPLIWLLVQRLWWGAFSYVVVAVLFGVTVHYLAFGAAGIFVIGLLIHLWVAFDGNDMRRRHLLHRGYAEIARLSGRDREEAERIFFARWLPEPEQAAPSQPPAPRPPLRPDDPQIVGLFPEPRGGR